MKILITKDKWVRYLAAAVILIFWQCIGYLVPLPFSPIWHATATSYSMSIVGVLIAFFSAFIADFFITRWQKAHSHPSAPKSGRRKR
ncbi:hypothetical protein [Ethanoligenens harbinense]|uniref:Uncharacterized protein n=1 Tax=Ethanoligenens harbinense (strain DSM 18485 / JCM 12961 / CGMCC 1.5033 / YUAN-3) TaxID=663278 RepID=E6U6R8_ETHHY|nr:hypothetical protein [Ethanoligenens harbinense]ADU25801.1 hypothetical protein Ethha_0214 [Ethanoligenens harbinense YUAN-3]